MSTDLSIIVTVYNAEKYIWEFLDSVRTQSFTDWECICVDDGSKDGSPAILDEFAAKDARFRVVHKTNEGVGKARNVGLSLASGKWVTWADADDLLAPSRLETAYRILESENPDVLQLWFLMNKDLPSGFDEIGVDAEYSVIDNEVEAFAHAWREMRPFGMLWLYFVKRELMEGLQYREEMRVKGDGILVGDFLSRAKKICQCHHVGYFYRLTPVSIFRSERKAIDCIRYQNALLDLWNKYRPQAEKLGAKAIEALRSDLRYSVESDLIDWLLGRRQYTWQEAQDVRTAYCRIKSSGACHARSRITPYNWLGIELYDVLGLEWPIIWINQLVSKLRKFKRNG